MLGRLSASDLGCCGCKIWSQKFDFSSEIWSPVLSPNLPNLGFLFQICPKIGVICPILVRFYPIGSKNRPKCQKKSPKWTKVAKSKALHLTEKMSILAQIFPFFFIQNGMFEIGAKKWQNFEKFVKNFKKRPIFGANFSGFFSMESIARLAGWTNRPFFSKNSRQK